MFNWFGKKERKLNWQFWATIHVIVTTKQSNRSSIIHQKLQELTLCKRSGAGSSKAG